MTRLLPTLALVWALTATAADRLDVARAQAHQAQTQVSELRGRQTQLKGELDALGGRIESLKGQAKGTLLPGGELDGALKRSQELSGALTQLATQAERASSDAERANAALAAALSEELGRLRSSWDHAGREERAKLVAKMRTLRAERDSLRSALPAAQVPALSQGSDDPAELLEQADALRDAEDKVKKRLQALEARISEAREERELDRRMGEFASEGAVFDEQDRRLRLNRDPHLREFSVQPPFSVGGVQDSAANEGGAGASGFVPRNTPIGPATPRPPSNPLDSRVVANEGDDLGSLERQREQLKKLAADLEQQARQAEQKARTLSD